jgi:hypothetical protein
MFFLTYYHLVKDGMANISPETTDEALLNYDAKIQI